MNEARCGCQARCRKRASISCEISCELTSRKSHIWLESQKFTTLNHMNLLLNQTVMLCLHSSAALSDGPAAAASALSSSLDSAVMTSTALRPMFPLVSRGVIHGSRNDRTAEYFHLSEDRAALPLRFSLLSLFFSL
ncbi:hypothetical protein EYF80_004625 [Liparis tanakae]|uniref:Uncharacterized protein n=1 Tax=Liparis tanakae TaxID=230148 RepID=A0A4Z2J4V0_9TELE|nr:hypothetical protein EYF80_004625 [Liparis tanakae]